MTFYNKMKELESKLHSMGFDVYSPQLGEGEDFLSMADEKIRKGKGYYVSLHRGNIQSSGAILVANFEKNGIPNYIGPSTFAEIGMAYAFGKKIFLLNEISKTANKIEELGLDSIVLKGNLEKIKSELER